jgi:hypothetical protein
VGSCRATRSSGPTGCARACRRHPSGPWVGGSVIGGSAAPLSPLVSCSASDEISKPSLDRAGAKLHHHRFPAHPPLGQGHRERGRDRPRHAVDVVRIDLQRRVELFGGARRISTPPSHRDRRRSGPQHIPWRPGSCRHAAASIPPPRAKNSISKMLVGLAVGGYSYDPTTRSNVPKEIAEDLTKLGLSIGDGTVRKILNDAVDDVGYLVKSK